MKRVLIFVFVVALMGVVNPVNATSRSQEKSLKEVLSRGRGFYKDVFMDGGVALTSRYYLPATRYLGLSIDYFASAKTDKLTQADTLMQTNIFCGSEEDTNGWLLYPDGAPRFRVIYVNGGKSGSHARSLTERGRELLREYIANGGSYVGTCAGAYMATSGSRRANGSLRNADVYLGLWPGYAKPTNLKKARPTLTVDKKSPLLRYFDFGGDKTVVDVYHNGGCSAYGYEDATMPKGTEPLAYYQFEDTKKVKIDGRISVWAYKPSKQSGRVVMCGSHPESVAEGERVEFMSAMLLYAMDGNPQPQLKGALKAGEEREMNKSTEDCSPEYTKIGDKQYHHFIIEVPRGCKRAVISLDGYEDAKKYDLTLCAKRGEFAFHDNTLNKVVSRGCKKQLVLEKPKAGKWYVSVFCETTVTALRGKYGTRYSGRVGVLNGVPYKISVKYE